MPEVSFDNLLIVCVIAVAVPLLLGLAPRLRVPSVVIEIIVGVIVGPSVLGWVQIDLPVQILAVFGLAFLLFLAGLEIDLRGLRGNLLQIAVLGYLVTLVLGVAVGAGFGALNWVSSPLLVAIALSATSLGLIVPVLKDAGQADSPVGQTTIAASSVADFSAIVLLTLFFSTSGGGVGEKLVLLVIFAALVGVGAVLLLRVGRSMRLGTVLVRIQDTTAEIRVRFAVLLLVALVALAGHLGLETILGAFLAGAIVGLVDQGLEHASAFPDQARGHRVRLPDPGVLHQQRGATGPVGSAGQPVRADPGAVVPARPAGCPRRTGAAVDPPPGQDPLGGVRAAAGDVPAVHRHRQPDRDGRRVDDTDHRRGAGLRRPAVRTHLPGGRTRSAAIRTGPPQGHRSGLRPEPNLHRVVRQRPDPVTCRP